MGKEQAISPPLGATEDDYVYIGPTPADEDCAPNTEAVRGRREMRAYRNQLRRVFGPEPQGARLRIKTFNMGEYSDLVCEFEVGNREALDYALRVEGHCPSNWDLAALVELTAGIVPTKDSDGHWRYEGVAVVCRD